MATIRLDRALEALFYEPFDSPQEAAEEVMRLLRDHLEAHPEDIGLLVPEAKLVKRPMTPVERAAETLPKANAVRREKRQRRLSPVIEAIRSLLRLHPDMKPNRVAFYLNQTDHQPPRAGRWNARSVKRIMEEFDLAKHQPPKT